MAMPWSRRRRIAEETRLASCASRGGGGFVEHHQPRCAVDQRAGNLHQLALGQAQVAHQPFGVDRQLPVLLENCAVAAFIRRRSSAPQRVRYSWPRNTDSATVKCGIRFNSWWITRMRRLRWLPDCRGAAGDRRGWRCRCRPDRHRRGS